MTIRKPGGLMRPSRSLRVLVSPVRLASPQTAYDSRCSGPIPAWSRLAPAVA